MKGARRPAAILAALAALVALAGVGFLVLRRAQQEPWERVAERLTS